MKSNENGSLYHIAIAVKNLKESEKLYEMVMGLKITHREEVAEQGVRASMLQPQSGEGTAIELLEPTGEDSPIHKFLETKGEGIHHICFFVDDIEKSLAELKNQGVRLIDETPRVGAYNSKVAFVHPKAMNGVLVELAEMAE
ncbi:MAG: methylmalonyl-CoA epimerase [Candidatus Mycalebacterium zealandia]|nr:MAG: methylmalonyl-CoA epimerase [Candidatus Mycalebacterium zealandia]